MLAMSPTGEPVRLATAITTALVAIWGVLVIVFNIDPDIAGAVNTAISAVVIALGLLFVRPRVEPYVERPDPTGGA